MKLSERVRAVRWAFAKSDSRFGEACSLADEVEDLERLLLTLRCSVHHTAISGAEFWCMKLHGHAGPCELK